MNFSEYWQLYEELSSKDILIFNPSGNLNLQCHQGKKTNQKCDCISWGCLSIPVGAQQKYIILRSPITLCQKHNKKSQLYGYHDETEKLYLGMFCISSVCFVYILDQFFL